MTILAHSILVFSAVMAAAKYTVFARLYYNRKDGASIQRVVTSPILAIGTNVVSLIILAIAWSQDATGQRGHYFEIATYITLYGLIISVYLYNMKMVVPRHLFGATAPSVVILAQYSATLWTTHQDTVGTILTVCATIVVAGSTSFYFQWQK